MNIPKIPTNITVNIFIESSHYTVLKIYKKFYFIPAFIGWQNYPSEVLDSSR